MRRRGILPYRMPAPPAGDHVRWPDSFGRRFTVFVDVEEEFDWTAPLDRTNRSVSATAALPAAHARFAARGIGLACMVDHPVAADPAAADVLRAILADGRSTLGAQLHPWVTPPYAPAAPGDSYAGNLPPALEAAKLDTLTDLLRSRFGRAPLAYRAGRYGIGPGTRALLVERGYRIEASARARYTYVRDGGPDFAAVGNAAFRSHGLLELPLTTVFTGPLRRAGSRLFGPAGRIPHLRGALARGGLLQRVALTPEDMPVEAAMEAVRIAIGEDDLRLLAFSFHSPSLVAGHTPYVRDAADLKRFWSWWDRMLALLESLDVAPVGLDAVIAAADRA